MVACRAHNPEVGGSNPPPATKNVWRRSLVGLERPVHTRQVGGSNPPAATKHNRPHGQEVKTSPFQGGIASSILAGVTRKMLGRNSKHLFFTKFTLIVELFHRVILHQACNCLNCGCDFIRQPQIMFFIVKEFFFILIFKLIKIWGKSKTQFQHIFALYKVNNYTLFNVMHYSFVNFTQKKQYRSKNNIKNTNQWSIFGIVLFV